MSVRKRSWGSSNNTEAWVVDFRDTRGRRRLKTFKTKNEADRFAGLASAVRSGLVPEPVSQAHKAIEFTANLPDVGFRYKGGRELLRDALRSACPMSQPAVNAVVLHIVAEMSPRHVVADVDNLLKPVMDALTGLAWVNDTQICELNIRRIPSSRRRLRIKLWEMPGGDMTLHINVLEHISEARARGAVIPNPRS